ncbi:MAG: efflux RND transporter periplasmic adaptor subunit [Methylococcales bacterium]|jgi:multidrug efflux pump subunit AcrA (membrane-fusion protein)|nr:efflux RND transporter periplasmic adaptor subunit [Methylococcales bacterium]MBT7443709.1 efflux RND transporter periplasmic adaptor subunit [Methylococcales bacterium]
MQRKFLSLIIAGALGLSAMSVSLQSQASAEGGTYTVKLSSEPSLVVLGGTVIPYKDVTLSAQIPGRVMYIAGVEGSNFVKGTVLVAVSEDELTAQREVAQAALSSAQAQLRNAKVQHQHELYGTKSNMMTKNSPFEMMNGWMPQNNSNNYADRARSVAGVQAAQSQVNSAISQIQGIDAKLRDAKSVAPIDGVVVKKYIEVGDTVQPGQPLLQFSDIKFLQIKVKVPARQVENVKEGMYFEARLDVQENKVVPVRVAQVHPLADERHTVTVKLDLPQGSSAGPGMYAEVMIPDLTRDPVNVAKIPKSAIRWRGSLPQIYVLKKDGKPALRAVRIGEQVGDDYIVLSGVSEGDVILTNPDRRAVNQRWDHK